MNKENASSREILKVLFLMRRTSVLINPSAKQLSQAMENIAQIPAKIKNSTKK